MATNIERRAAAKKLQRQIADALKIIEPSDVLGAFANVCPIFPEQRQDGRNLHALGIKVRRLEMQWRLVGGPFDSN